MLVLSKTYAFISFEIKALSNTDYYEDFLGSAE
jgi:hypothetical protein